MIVEDQQAVVDLLSSPSTYGGVPVERIETHAAIVFLAGDRAYKLKRAVRFDYLDFSTADRRRAMCDAEVELNRRTAPTLYHGVVAVTREPDGTLALDGTGLPVDWLVVMRRFDQELLFDRLAARGALPLELMPPLAVAVARFHREAAARRDHGGAAGMRWVVDGNAAGFEEFGRGFLDPALCERVTEASRAEIDARQALLDERRARGFVRQCHGDLHLRNIVLLEGQPTLFDAIEFNDEIACVDVLYDLAFLLMDLWRRELPVHANRVWNRYLFESDDLEGLPLMPLFLSCRAAVRAKTSATAADVQSDPSRRNELQTLARDYLAMADRLLKPRPPTLIAIGGFSGTGKTTVALSLAPSVGAVPGAVVLRSDELRKRLCGVSPLERLGPEAYTPEMSARVYAALAERASAIARAGVSVIVDAVCRTPAERQQLEQAACAAGVAFAGIWLEAPESVLIERASRREHDASDADANVVRQQVRQPTGDITWSRVDASGAPEDVRERVEKRVRAQAPGASAR